MSYCCSCVVAVSTNNPGQVAGWSNNYMTIFRTASIFFPGKLAFKRKFSWKTGLPCLWHNMACFIVNSPQIFGNILKLFLWIRSTPPQFGKRTARGRWVDGSCSSVRMMALQRTAEKIVSSSPSCVSKRLVRSYVLKVHMFLFCSVSSFHVKRRFPRPRLLLGEIIRIDEDPLYVIGSTTTDIYIYIDTLYWLYAYIHRSSIFKSSSVNIFIKVAEAKCGFYCEVRTLDPQEVGVRMVGDGPGSNGWVDSSTVVGFMAW